MAGNRQRYYFDGRTYQNNVVGTYSDTYTAKQNRGFITSLNVNVFGTDAGLLKVTVNGEIVIDTDAAAGPDFFANTAQNGGQRTIPVTIEPGSIIDIQYSVVGATASGYTITYGYDAGS